MAIEYWQGTNGIGASAKATLTLTSVRCPASLATQWMLPNIPVWVASDDEADTRVVEQADSSDDYATWVDESGAIGTAGKKVEALAKV